MDRVINVLLFFAMFHALAAAYLIFSSRKKGGAAEQDEMTVDALLYIGKMMSFIAMAASVPFILQVTGIFILRDKNTVGLLAVVCVIYVCAWSLLGHKLKEISKRR